MRRIGSGLVLAALIGAAFAVVATPAAAEFFGCREPRVTVRNYGGASSHYASARTTHEFAAQSSRPRITVSQRQNRGRYY